MKTVQSFSRRTWIVMLVCGSGIGLLAVSGWVYRTLRVDYGALPPAQVFQQVFRQPIPRGVSDLQVAGHGFFQSHKVWMRFRATDPTIQLLTQGNRKLDDKEWDRYVSPILEDSQALAVGWEEVLHLLKPEYYEFSAVENGMGWYGVLVVDWEERTVFVQAIVL